MTASTSGEDGRAAARPHGIRSRLKGLALLITAAAAVLGLAAATQTWFTFTLGTAADGSDTVTVPGTTAAPAMTALSLAALALTAALAIAGRVARLVLGLLGAALAASVGYSAISALAAPIAAGGSAVTTKTGIAGDASVARLVTHISVTPWPALGITAGALLLVSAAIVLATGHRWPGPSKKYRAVRFEPAGETDPAVGDAPAGPAGEHTAASAAAPDEDPDAEAARRRDHAIDSWDELSRGDDPTAGS